jgi:hypothetical protein
MKTVFFGFFFFIFSVYGKFEEFVKSNKINASDSRIKMTTSVIPPLTMAEKTSKEFEMNHQVKQNTITPTLEEQRHVLNMQEKPSEMQNQPQVDVILSARDQDIPVFSHHSFKQIKQMSDEKYIYPIKIKVNVRFNPKTTTSSKRKE